MCIYLRSTTYILLTKLYCNIVNTRLHVLQHILREVLDGGEATLLKAVDIRQEGQQLLSEVMAYIPQILIRAEKSPRHQWRYLFRYHVEMCHESVGEFEHALLCLQHRPNGSGEGLKGRERSEYQYKV